jgi:hypothetical protein
LLAGRILLIGTLAGSKVFPGAKGDFQGAKGEFQYAYEFSRELAGNFRVLIRMS